MAGKVFEINCGVGHSATITALTDAQSILLLSEAINPQDEERTSIRLFVQQSEVQTMLDRLQVMLATDKDSIILVTAVDVLVDTDQPEAASKANSSSATREELFEQVSDATQYSLEFVIFALLATIVATIGIAENNSAVVIGAMVIAPLLGPNLGLALGASLGDKELIRSAIITNAIGLLLTIATAYCIALVWPPNTESQELLSRTIVGPSTAILALASGAAAALSLTSRMASALVGVMVAVALLPPAVVMAMMGALSNWPLAINAGLLLVINFAAINISAQLVFVIQGVRPRTWLAKREAKETRSINVTIWILMLLICFTALTYLD